MISFSIFIKVIKKKITSFCFLFIWKFFPIFIVYFQSKMCPNLKVNWIIFSQSCKNQKLIFCFRNTSTKQGFRKERQIFEMCCYLDLSLKYHSLSICTPNINKQNKFVAVSFGLKEFPCKFFYSKIFSFFFEYELNKSCLRHFQQHVELSSHTRVVRFFPPSIMLVRNFFEGFWCANSTK